MEEAKIIKTISARGTLEGIPVGDSRIIKSRVIKQSVIRATITRMNKAGFNFTASEAGMTDELLVTRNK